MGEGSSKMLTILKMNNLGHGVQEEKESANALFVFQKVKEIYNT